MSDIPSFLSRFRWFRALKGGAWIEIESGGVRFWQERFLGQEEIEEMMIQEWVTRREFYTPFEPSLFHDGYHTVADLYHHRCLLFCLVLGQFGGWKSKCHADGNKYAGWFVAGCELNQQPITYHLPMDLWDLCDATELPKGKPWDGHSSKDVLDRIREYLEAKR